MKYRDPSIAIISGVLTIGVRMTGSCFLRRFSQHGHSADQAAYCSAYARPVIRLWRPDWTAYSGEVAAAGFSNEFLVGVGMELPQCGVRGNSNPVGLGIQMGYSLVNILDPQTQVGHTVSHVLSMHRMLLF